MSLLAMPRGLYFEDFVIGQTLVTSPRTITETDVVNFAYLTGDFNRIHTDAEYAKTTPFGQRIAHGLCVMSIASGLVVLTGVMDSTVLAFREVSEWRFSKPVFIGDTVRARLEVVETKAIPRLKGGSVSIKVEVLNQRDEVAQHGQWVMLMLSRPADPAPNA